MRQRIACYLIGLLAVLMVAETCVAQRRSRWDMGWSRILRQPRSWYGSDEAVRIAENVLAYQHPTGGWPKNINMAREMSAKEREAIRQQAPEMQPIIDNGATHTQLRFLARVYEQTHDARFRDAVLRGIDYVLEAQYPNGGWPMMYPLRSGYVRDITFNDGAMIGVMNVLRAAAAGQREWELVDQERRDRAAEAVQRGVDVILKCQIEQDGKLTAWCAQHDPKDLSPAKARAFELASISGQESVGVVRFLMGIEDPSPQVVTAIESAVDWFERSKVTGLRVEYRRTPDGPDRVAVDDPDAPVLWARFYDIKTNKPLYVGRDSVPVETFNQIERERRMGYSYLGTYADTLLSRDYPRWRERMDKATN